MFDVEFDEYVGGVDYAVCARVDMRNALADLTSVDPAPVSRSARETLEARAVEVADELWPEVAR